MSTGDVDLALVLAICGIAALYVPKRQVDPDRGREWLAAAEHRVIKHLDQPSIFRIQALLLVIYHSLESRSFSKAFMLIALAARSAFALRLNYEHPQLPFEQQEIRRRIMWSIWAMEKTWSGGVLEFKLCHDSTMHIRLPCPEDCLENGTAVEMDFFDPDATVTALGTPLNALAQCIRLLTLRNACLRWAIPNLLSYYPI